MQVSKDKIREVFLRQESILYILNGAQSEMKTTFNEKTKKRIIANIREIATEDFFNCYSSINECQLAVIDAIVDDMSTQETNESDKLTYENYVLDLVKKGFDEPREVIYTSKPKEEEQQSSEIVTAIRELMNINNKPFDYNPFRYATLALDTKNRNLSDSNPGSRRTLSWVYSSNNAQWVQGSATSTIIIKNAIGMECGILYLPIFDNSLIGEYKQISMFINEFSSQSTYITSKTRYHFLFNAEIVPNNGGGRLRLSPVYGDVSEIRFDPPIPSISNLTISFSSPADPLSFGFDRDTSPTVQKGISTGDPTTILTSHDHNLTNGDLVYLEGFTTADAAADAAVITAANSVNGYIISNVTSNSFDINALDTSSITAAITLARVIYGSKRFFIPLKFKLEKD